MSDDISLPPDAITTPPLDSIDPKIAWYKKLGPGLITGAADDDPSGIATYSQSGAQFGFNLLWTLFLTYPLMVGIQVISARIGRVSGHGLASNIRQFYPAWLLYGIVSLLLVANTINIAADISAMGQAMQLVTGGHAHIYAAALGLLSLLLQIFVPYKRYVNVLKWLTLVLLAYVATAFTVNIPWGAVARGAFAPHFALTKEYITTVVAIFGTTISPYLFFWQASQEVEEQLSTPRAKPLVEAPEQAAFHLKRIKFDTYLGMGFSNLIAFFILLTAAVALHQHGTTNIETSAQAAMALKPIAGQFAFIVFTIGIIGTGMLAVPVLAGSSAYAMAGAFKWENSLEHLPERAKAFYGVIAVSTIIGTGICFTAIDPIKALYWSAVLNGVISVPIMVVTMLMAVRRDIMGPFVITWKLKWLGWLATLTMLAAVLFMLATLGQGS